MFSGGSQGLSHCPKLPQDGPEESLRYAKKGLKIGGAQEEHHTVQDAPNRPQDAPSTALEAARRGQGGLPWN